MHKAYLITWCLENLYAHQSVAELWQFGLALNTSNPMVITTELQPPKNVTTGRGEQLQRLAPSAGHKVITLHVECPGSENADIDWECHLPSASRAFDANKLLLLGKNCIQKCVNPKTFAVLASIMTPIITPIACFGACSRTVHSSDVAKLDAHSRKLVRSVVRPPAGVNWSDPWHNVVHVWGDNTCFKWSRHVMLTCQQIGPAEQEGPHQPSFTPLSRSDYRRGLFWRCASVHSAT